MDDDTGFLTLTDEKHLLMAFTLHQNTYAERRPLGLQHRIATETITWEEN